MFLLCRDRVYDCIVNTTTRPVLPNPTVAKAKPVNGGILDLQAAYQCMRTSGACPTNGLPPCVNARSGEGCCHAIRESQHSGSMMQQQSHSPFQPSRETQLLVTASASGLPAPAGNCHLCTVITSVKAASLLGTCRTRAGFTRAVTLQSWQLTGLCSINNG
jgi:hypothetical protein